MTPRPQAARVTWLLCSLLILSRPAASQPLSSLEFSFSAPGARSLGFGGAFIAVADDATAAYSNPAGLVLIAEPEVFVELRSWGYSTPYTRGGRASGEPTGSGIDTVAVPLRGESNDVVSGLSFVSYVYPMKRWSVAFFRHQLADFEFALETQGVFGIDSVGSETIRTQIQTSRVDTEVLTDAVVVAWRPVERLSVGFGLSRFESRIAWLGWDYLPHGGEDGLFSEASFDRDRLVQTVDLRSDDVDWGVAFGFLFRLSGRWSLGGIYREAPRTEVEIDLEAGPANPDFEDGFRFVEGVPMTLQFPDVYGLGLTYRSRGGRWTGALDWKRVEHSNILESLLPEQRDPGDALDDADEIHLGGEYAFFVSTSVLAIRAGVWLDPDHQFRTEADDPFLRAILPPGEDQLHFAAGFGLAWNALQIDLGIDLSERVDTFSLSAIYGF